MTTAIDRAGGGLWADLSLYALSGAFAWWTATSSTLLPHRAWGTVAVYGYAAGGVLVLAQLVLRSIGVRRGIQASARAGLSWLVFAATALLPLVWQAMDRAAGRTDRAQEEVLVIEAGGHRLLETGTPYLGRAAISALPLADRLLAYLPYQPAMALFGVPRALDRHAAWWSDARVWFALATVVVLVIALRILRRAGSRPGGLVRALQSATVLPICALTLATGGDDLPVLALCLLALALSATRRIGRAGAVVGLAAALKLFAWPVALVLAVLAYTRRQSIRYAIGAIGLPIVTALSAVWVDWVGLVENVLAFPFGKGVVSSPAASPLPGHLAATLLPGGPVVAAGLLLLTGLTAAVLLARHPPRTAAAAAWFCGYGLLAAVLLLPSSRFGYLLYPVAIFVWAGALRLPKDEILGSLGRYGQPYLLDGAHRDRTAAGPRPGPVAIGPGPSISDLPPRVMPSSGVTAPHAGPAVDPAIWNQPTSDQPTLSALERQAEDTNVIDLSELHRTDPSA